MLCTNVHATFSHQNFTCRFVVNYSHSHCHPPPPSRTLEYSRSKSRYLRHCLLWTPEFVIIFMIIFVHTKVTIIMPPWPHYNSKYHPRHNHYQPSGIWQYITVNNKWSCKLVFLPRMMMLMSRNKRQRMETMRMVRMRRTLRKRRI